MYLSVLTFSNTTVMMTKLYKEPYQTPEAKPFSLPQSMHLLINFSIDGNIVDPEWDDDWGTIGYLENDSQGF